MMLADQAIRAPEVEIAPRAEYQALVDGYPDLLRPFGVALSATDLADLSILMAAMEHVDRVLDGEPSAVRRIAFAARVIDQLAGTEAERTLPQVCALRQVAVRRAIAPALEALIGEALANCEQIRSARGRDHYLACVEREGTLCIELALLVVPLPAGPAAFLRAIAPAANLMDKLIDLRGDHARGEVAVDPGARTHALLAARLVRHAWSASRLHPDPARFTRWGLGWWRRMKQ